VQRLRGLTFHHPDNPQVMAWSRRSDDGSDVVLVVANLDPANVQEATLYLDLQAIGLGDRLRVDDALSGQGWDWTGPAQYVRLDPADAPAHLFTVTAR
jgi:starch synthase (maltosyl-transferring)